MSDAIFVAELSWQEFQEKASRGAVVFVPVGATEQHGRHMSLARVLLQTSLLADFRYD
jgi:creatinine amidohydrolase